MNLSKALGRSYWGMLGGVCLAGLLLSGCGSARDKRFAELPGVAGNPPAAPAAASAAGINIDMILPGQPLLITITDLPMMQQPIQDQVKQDGTITLLLNKTFAAAGKTRRQLEQEVHDYYVPAIYKQMTVSIQAQQQTRFYFVDGEVNNRGSRQVYMGPMTVLKAVASAGGFSDFANRSKVKLIHPNGQTQVINCRKAVDQPALDLPVYPDDKVIVPRRLFW